MKTKAELRKCFDTFDTDKSGTLSADEFLKILTRAGDNSLSEEDAMEIIEEFDTNADGVLSFEECAPSLTLAAPATACY